MNVEVPPLFISSSAISKSRLRDAQKFIGWDTALEDFISTPISKDLTLREVSWKIDTMMSADDVPIDIELGPHPDKDDEFYNLQVKDSRQIRAKSRQMRAREILVHKRIKAPPTPRKNNVFPKIGSLSMTAKSKNAMHDRKGVETIFHSRSQRPTPLKERPIMKSDRMQVARTFNVYMNPSLQNAMNGKSDFLY